LGHSRSITTEIKYGPSRERDAKQHHIEQRVFLDGRTFCRQRCAVLAFAWQPRNTGVFSFFRFVLALLDSAAQSAADRYFVTGPSSHNALHSGPEQIPIRYIFGPVLAVKQVQERVASSNPLSAFVAKVRECVLNPISTDPPR
jgi:hypothetical protein